MVLYAKKKVWETFFHCFKTSLSNVKLLRENFLPFQKFLNQCGILLDNEDKFAYQKIRMSTYLVIYT